MSDERGEGLRERLEWIVASANRRFDLLGDDGEAFIASIQRGSEQRRNDHLCCAIRELAGQRHELRRQLDVIDDFSNSIIDHHRGLIDTAIERAERAEAERDATAQRAGAAEFTRGEWRRRAEAAEERVRELEAEVVAWQGFFEQERPGLVDVTPHIDGAGRHAYDGPEPFDAWHARECPWSVAVDCDLPPGPCITHTHVPWGRGGPSWFDPFVRRFAGRTCRDVYAAEVLGRGGEEGAGE